jgi:hypothetical protein
MVLDRNSSVGISDLNPRLSRLSPRSGELKSYSFLSVSRSICYHPEAVLILDSVNISLPFSKEDMGDRDQPWPHVDQSPNRRFKHCVQGIMNLVSPLSISSDEELMCSTRTVPTMVDSWS